MENIIELSGAHGVAKVFTLNIESEAISQVINLLNQEFVEGSNIRIMPDVHAGKGCTIGFTMKMDNSNLKICPNLVGVDIGCGVSTMAMDVKESEKFEFAKSLDDFINANIPHGFGANEKVQDDSCSDLLKALKCYGELNKVDHIERSLGSLGGGNHYIEAGMVDDEKAIITVHSGSRNLGQQVCDFYQGLAKANCKIGQPDLAYLSGDLAQDYLHDMLITQHYANLNRENMLKRIALNFDVKKPVINCVIHNYIEVGKDFSTVRKGAISAKKGELVAIPISMADGIIIGVGKGNPDWNESAPHGAGRVLSRSEAKANVQMKDFEEKMDGIYTTSICKATLDEAPQAYKRLDEIVEAIKDTVDIVSIVKPFYNFKSH